MPRIAPKGSKSSFSSEAQSTARKERAVQRRIESSDRHPPKKNGKAMQAGARVYPEPPLPEQHLEKPGHRGRARARSRCTTRPHYKGSEKLLDKVALITGGDSGIGRAVAVLFAREGADVAIAYLDEHEDAEETKRAVEDEGRRCILLPGDVADPKFCKAGGRDARSRSSASSTSWSTTPRSRSTSTTSRS